MNVEPRWPEVRPSSHGRRGPWHPGWVAGGAVVVLATWLAFPGEISAQRTGRAGAECAGLWASDSPLPDGRRLLMVVDPATRHAAVYHVDADRGTLTLRSARDMSWDLMVEDFNAQEPKPSALRNLFQGGAAPSPERPPPGP
jgi:hypothetical protein